MSELRQDIATKRWVIVAQERARRPDQFVREKKQEEPPEYLESCPFCIGNEHMTPPEVYALREQSEPNSPGWKVRVITNKFCALSPSTKLEVHRENSFTKIAGFGVHEVVVETPQHNQTLATLPQEQMENILEAVVQRLRTLAQDHRIAFTAVFRNNGAAAGTSLVHPHSQLIATPTVPMNLREEIAEARRFYDDRMHCVYCYVRDKELELGSRIVLESDDFVVFTPFASRFPFEMMILPKQHSPSFLAHAREGDIKAFADILRRTLLLLHLSTNNPDYNMVVHTAPPRDSCQDYFHWHIEIIPRLTTPAGFEMGTGIYITTAIPEDTAAFLREHLPQMEAAEKVAVPV
jgi:UDPglucose--hexose-1-phosphate uridylyltransferase